MTTADLLLTTANHIERVGHHKGSFYDRYGRDLSRSGWTDDAPCCVVGGMLIAAQRYHMQWHYANDALAEYLGISRSEVAFWNDAPERTADEVVAALRGAAAKVG